LADCRALVTSPLRDTSKNHRKETQSGNLDRDFLGFAVQAAVKKCIVPVEAGVALRRNQNRAFAV
jgi:hypothetical protein